MEIRNIGVSPPSVVSEIGRAGKGGKDTQIKQVAPHVQTVEQESLNAFFAVDENKNVVIRIADANGKVVKQIPAEEYLKMTEFLLETSKNLFHREA